MQTKRQPHSLLQWDGVEQGFARVSGKFWLSEAVTRCDGHRVWKGAQPGMVHRVVNAASVVVWLPLRPLGYALDSGFSWQSDIDAVELVRRNWVRIRNRDLIAVRQGTRIRCERHPDTTDQIGPVLRRVGAA